ncbi:MAG: hypothetical protein GX366_01305 [Epulopiscium sp.]|nr:hypothetical protein [Candidatus Epulonipiscium sp.]
MIIREKDYLKKRKRKYLLASLMWLVIMFAIFLLGYMTTKTRGNIYTVLAAILVLPVAQYSTQLFVILRFKDPDPETSKQLESIKGKYSLFHSALIPDEKRILYFDHIFVTGSKIYCIMENPKDINDTKRILNKKLKAKGISLNKVVYIEKEKTKDLGNLFKKIEKDAIIEREEDLKEYTQLIAQMMM